jgi:acyl-homoserine-lactone acylase
MLRYEEFGSRQKDRPMRHRTWFAALALFATAAPTRPPQGPEILWDSWRIAHIYAEDAPGLAYAYGWAQMESHGNLLLQLYGRAQGRAAEYWGEANLAEDRWVRTVGCPARARKWYAAQAPAFRSYLDAFAAGIDAYVRAHPERIVDSVKPVLPIHGVDVLGHHCRLMYSYFLTSRSGVNDRTRAWMDRGSNAWAVAPNRSASGHTLLLANPHLPWSGAFTWFEAQLVAPGIDAYGAALVGAPILQIAFNDHLGWTHTVNTQDVEDLYELTLADSGYRWEGRIRPFETERQILKVKLPTGGFRKDTLVIRRSVHGPVVQEKHGKAIALRVVAIERGGADKEWWDMARAGSLAEFQTAIRQMQISVVNIIYADRDGNIMYFYGGNSPVRPRGDRAYWAGIVPGDSLATLWTGLHSFEDMPLVVNPPTGWLQNTNDPPWWCTFPAALKPTDFPSYLAPRSLGFRSQRSIRLLLEDSSLTFDEFVASKHSTRMELADRLLGDLIAAVRANGGGPARRAADVLSRWDRSADSESRGAVLFSAWWDEYGRRIPTGRSPFATPWSEAAPRTTPNGLADPTTAVAALAAAAMRIDSTYGALDVPWGDVYRVRRDSLDFPSNGAPAELGVFRVIGYDSIAGHRLEATGGDSYVVAIEFGRTVRAMALVPYGNWSQPGSRHRTDQLVLFMRKELRPVWRTRAGVERHLEAREELSWVR